MIVLFVWINIIFDLNPEYEAISIFIERGEGVLVGSKSFYRHFWCMYMHASIRFCAHVR